MNLAQLEKMAFGMPPKESPVWDSAAAAYPAIGGPVLGRMRAPRGREGRGMALGLVGGLGGAAAGSAAGKSLGSLAALVLSKVMAKRGAPEGVIRALMYSNVAGAAAGGAAGVRLTTSKQRK